jgi:hypothetical protein
MSVGLAGARLRVTGADAGAVRRVLDDGGVAASVTTGPATLEEKFVALARQ